MGLIDADPEIPVAPCGRLVGDFQQPVDEKTKQEQHYIRTEARKLMHEHGAEQNLHIITKEIQDAHDRMDVAVHYKIPYPRHHHYHGANSKDVREVGGAASVYREIPE